MTSLPLRICLREMELVCVRARLHGRQTDRFRIMTFSSMMQFSPMMIGPETAMIVHFGWTTHPEDAVRTKDRLPQTRKSRESEIETVSNCDVALEISVLADCASRPDGESVFAKWSRAVKSAHPHTTLDPSRYSAHIAIAILSEEVRWIKGKRTWARDKRRRKVRGTKGERRVRAGKSPSQPLAPLEQRKGERP
jgi:hypothetical protein